MEGINYYLESKQQPAVVIPAEEYESLVRDSEKLKIFRNLLWFTSERYGYTLSSVEVAAIFDDEEFLTGSEKKEFAERLAELVHDATTGGSNEA